jgi:hypothetical protein
MQKVMWIAISVMVAVFVLGIIGRFQDQILEQIKIFFQ